MNGATKLLLLAAGAAAVAVASFYGDMALVIGITALAAAGAVAIAILVGAATGAVRTRASGSAAPSRTLETPPAAAPLPKR